MAYDNEPCVDLSIHTQGHPIRARVEDIEGFSVLYLRVSAGLGHPDQEVCYFIKQPANQQVASLIADLSAYLPLQDGPGYGEEPWWA